MPFLFSWSVFYDPINIDDLVKSQKFAPLSVIPDPDQDIIATLRLVTGSTLLFTNSILTPSNGAWYSAELFLSMLLSHLDHPGAVVS
jgi:hypothetical protein